MLNLEKLVVYDVDGKKHELSTTVGYTMIIISWTTFSLSWLVNILDYMFIHPSMPDTDLGRFPSKLVIYILGERIDIRAIWGHQCLKGNDGTSDAVIQMENM